MSEDEFQGLEEILKRAMADPNVPEHIKEGATECMKTHVDVAPDFMTAMRHTLGVRNITQIMERALDYVEVAEDWSDIQRALFVTAIYQMLESMQTWYAHGLHVMYGFMGDNFIKQQLSDDNMFSTGPERYEQLINRMRKLGVMFSGDERMN